MEVMHQREFDGLVERALAKIPRRFRARMRNLAVVVEPEPSKSQLRRLGGSRGSSLLGLYEGRPLTERSVSVGFVMPDRITVFQGPHARLARDLDHLPEMAEDTVSHEVSHYFVMDERQVLDELIGTQNERHVKARLPRIVAINDLEAETEQRSDIDLAAKTIEFRESLAQGAMLDDLLVEAFAIVREAGRRVLNMRHFDEQLIGGIVLHQGKISEMKTGEGKTLVATLPVYLNALEGKGVHVVTVNDYLANPDSQLMGPLYKFSAWT